MKRISLIRKNKTWTNQKKVTPDFNSSFIAYVLIFTAALITLIIMLILIYVLYGQSKLKALVMNIAMQRIKAVEAADMSDMLCTCKPQWYIMGMLIILTLGMLYLVTNKLRKTRFCKGCLFSNNTKILLFISNAHSYVPIKIMQSSQKHTLIPNKRKIKPRKCET